MLLLKMPVEANQRPEGTPLKRVGPLEVLPLPQQTAPTTPQRLLNCHCRNSWRFGAATPSGRENRSLRTTHHDVQDMRKASDLWCKYSKLRHEQRPEVPELMQTLPWAVSSTWSALHSLGLVPWLFLAPQSWWPRRSRPVPSSLRVWGPSRCDLSVARRLPWRLERDARGLTFDVLSGCVGWDWVGWRGTCLKVTPVRHDLGRLTCLIRPSAQDHSAPAR